MKPIKYKQKQIDAWITEWRSSGLNAYQISLGKPFYPSTFLNWVRKSGEHTVKDKPSGFIRVDVQDPDPPYRAN